MYNASSIKGSPSSQAYGVLNGLQKDPEKKKHKPRFLNNEIIIRGHNDVSPEAPPNETSKPEIAKLHKPRNLNSQTIKLEPQM